MENKRVANLKEEIISNERFKLKRLTFDYLRNNGEKQIQLREVYDTGGGATILLYNIENKSIVLCKQFRTPTFVSGNKTGMLIETCAGLLDNDDPEDCIKRETQEETGYKLSNVEKIFNLYMSPGSSTEILHFFIAQYDSIMKISEGGGLESEQEEIEILELNFDDALKMIKTGEIKDAKTIILLQYLRLEQIL